MARPKKKTSDINIGEGNHLQSEKFLVEVASLFYEERLTQDDIARKKNVSRSLISKAIQRAQEKDIVRSVVFPRLEKGYLETLTRDLRIELRLEDLVLVAGRKKDYDKGGIDTYGSDPNPDTIADITSKAAGYVNGLLKDKSTLAVSGGKIVMRQLVSYLNPTHLLNNFTVTPAIGFISSETTLGNANLIAFDVALAYGATPHWLPIPAMLSDKADCERAQNFPIINSVLEQANNATFFLTGVWNYNKTQIEGTDGFPVTKKGKVDDFHQRAIAHINYWAFDKQGEIINSNSDSDPYFLTGLNLPEFKRKGKSASPKLILVGGGSQAQADAIKAVLRSGLVSILITDHITAGKLKGTFDTVE